MSSSASTRAGFRVAVVSALLFGGTLLLFSRVVGGEFLNYDDPLYVTDNPHVQGGLSWAGLVWAFTAPTAYWHPLAWLSHMLDWQLFGSSPAGHHLTSVLWHSLNAVLAFFLFRRLTGTFWRSAFAAALFAWHPLRTESVAWVTERKDVLSGTFFFLTLLAYARYVAARAPGRPATRAYLLTLAAFAAGLMSKPMLMTLPVILLLLDFWPFARGTSLAGWWRLVLEKLPFFALSAATAVTTLRMQQHVGAFVLDLPLSARAENAVVSLARYLGKFVWPTDLVVCYPHPGFWPAAAALGAVALLLGLAGLAWWQRRDRPWIAAGLGWFVVILLPVLGLVQVGFQAMADRYTYLALLGVELAIIPTLPTWTSSRGLVWSSGSREAFVRNETLTRSATKLLPHRTSLWAQILGISAAAVILIACAATTWKQESVWHDSVSLFAHAVQVSDRNDVAENFLASALAAAGRPDEAVEHARRAHALNPRNDEVLVMLASLSEGQGKTAEAMELYRSALALHPANPLVQSQLGLLEFGEGHTDVARELLTAALRADSGLIGRARQLGDQALAHRDAARALFLFETVLAVAPNDAEAHTGAGLALLARRDATGAIVHLRTAVKLAPDFADAQLALATCAEQLGLTSEATAALDQAVTAAPANPGILARAADLHARRREFPDAIRLYRRVIALAPSDAVAHGALGYLLIYTGDRAGGLAEWRRALELNPNLPGLREQLARATSQNP